MRIYLFKRVLYSVLVMWAVATLVFFMLRAIPGDPVAVILGEEATPEAAEKPVEEETPAEEKTSTEEEKPAGTE